MPGKTRLRAGFISVAIPPENGDLATSAAEDTPHGGRVIPVLLNLGRIPVKQNVHCSYHFLDEFRLYDLEIADYPAAVLEFPIIRNTNELPFLSNKWKERECTASYRAEITLAACISQAFDENLTRRYLLLDLVCHLNLIRLPQVP